MACKECQKYHNEGKTCNSCGKLPPVIEINNGECPILFHIVEVEGTPATNPPEIGKYKNVLTVYKEGGAKVIYSSDGVPAALSETVEFDYILNRPKYGGEPITSETDIPNLEGVIAELERANNATNERITTEIKDRTVADQQLSTQIDSLSSSLSAEQAARQQADNVLDGKINDEIAEREALSNKVDSVSGKVDQYDDTIADVRAEMDKVNDHLDEVEKNLEDDIVTDVTTTGDESSMSLNVAKKNLLTGATSEDATPFTIASSTSTGVMNSATFKAVQENAENIDAIMNASVAVEGISVAPAQEELTVYWQQATGRQKVINHASIYDITNNKIWTYYENINEWKQVGTEGSTVSVSQATNTSLGIVKGSEADGQVFVEPDGSMSLNGYDRLRSDIDNNLKTIENLNTEVTNMRGDVENALGDISAIEIDYARKDQIKTINGQSLIGTGNIDIEGGGGSNVELIDTYTEAPTDTQAYDAKYVNSRLDDIDVEIGDGASTTGLDTSSEPTNVYSDIAIGKGAKANNTLHSGTNDMYYSAIAIGANATADNSGSGSGWGSIAIGSNAKASYDSVIIGTYANGANKNNCVAIGRGASTGNSGTAIGYGAKVASTNGIAIGSSANSGSVGAVTVGAESTTGTGFGVSIGYSINNGPYSERAVVVGSNGFVANNSDFSAIIGAYGYTNRANELSIGHGGYFSSGPATRFIANVTAGEKDTDAVNVKQMKDYVEENASTAEVEGEVKQLQQTVDGISQNVSSLEQELGTVSNDVDSINAAIDTTVMTDLTLNAGASTTVVQLDTAQKNLKTGQNVEKNIPLPVANETQAGVMNSATFQAVSDNTDKINSLLNGAVAVGGLSDSPSQSDLTNAWKQATSLSDLINRAQIYDTTNSKTWVYYTNDSTWHDLGGGTGPVEINQFTNSALGTVKGSTKEGQIFAENDGTGSVNGWDALKASVDDATSKLSGIDAGAQKNAPLYTSTGQATNGAMTQKATTAMVYGENGSIQIGSNATASAAQSVAIGDMSAATVSHAVAVGDYSMATTQGEVSFGGTTLNSKGYKNTNYRKLTNVYNPENAQDAATKSYVDTAVSKKANADNVAYIGNTLSQPDYIMWGGITLSTTDIGEGAPLAEGMFYGVYDA